MDKYMEVKIIMENHQPFNLWLVSEVPEIAVCWRFAGRGNISAWPAPYVTACPWCWR